MDEDKINIELNLETEDTVKKIQDLKTEVETLKKSTENLKKYTR